MTALELGPGSQPLGLMKAGEHLVFDGKKLCRIDSSKPKGKTCVKCWKARSGKPLTDKSGKIVRDKNGMPVFPEPTKKLQKEKDVGPVPEGHWTIHSKRAKKPSEKGIWSLKDWNDYEDNRWFWETKVSKRTWGPWGGWFTRLTPGWEKHKTDTYGRSHINIHGGRRDVGGEWGSAGCIDLMTGDTSFFEDILRDGEGKDIKLLVDYSGKNMPKDCQEPKDDCNQWTPKK